MTIKNKALTLIVVDETDWTSLCIRQTLDCSFIHSLFFDNGVIVDRGKNALRSTARPIRLLKNRRVRHRLQDRPNNELDEKSNATSIANNYCSIEINHAFKAARVSAYQRRHVISILLMLYAVVCAG